MVSINKMSKKIVKTIILIIQLSLTFVSLGGTLSTFLLLGDLENSNIYIDFENVTVYLNATDPDNSNITIPIGINNVGIYDFTDINLSIWVDIYNSSQSPDHYEFLHGTKTWDRAIAGRLFLETVVFDNSTMNYDIPPGVLLEMDEMWEKNITIVVTSMYSINLISFKINITGSMDELFAGGSP